MFSLVSCPAHYSWSHGSADAPSRPSPVRPTSNAYFWDYCCSPWAFDTSTASGTDVSPLFNHKCHLVGHPGRRVPCDAAGYKNVRPNGPISSQHTVNAHCTSPLPRTINRFLSTKIDKGPIAWATLFTYENEHQIRRDSKYPACTIARIFDLQRPNSLPFQRSEKYFRVRKRHKLDISQMT